MVTMAFFSGLSSERTQYQVPIQFILGFLIGEGIRLIIILTVVTEVPLRTYH